MNREQELRIAATINAQGFDPSKEVGDLPYFVGVNEWKERHGAAQPDKCEQVTAA